MASTTVLNRATTRGLFYPAMAMVAILFSVAAFGPSMINTAGRNGPLTGLVVVHGLVSLAWLFLFLVQSLLPGLGRIALHRRLGTFSVALAAAMVALGYAVAIAMGRRGFDLSGDVGARSDPLAAMAFPLLDTFMFAALFAAAFLYRRRGAIHKRLMLLAVVGAILPAPVAHFTGHYAFFHGKGLLTPLILALFLAAGAIHDWSTQRRIHPVSLWVPVAVFVIENLWFVVVIPSHTWHRIAAALLGGVGPAR